MTTLFKELANNSEILILPGVYDAFSAKLAEKAGLTGCIMGGYQISASVLGQPDVGYLSITEMVYALKKICDATSIPVLADGDTGYGNALNVQRMVREYEDAGAAAILIEDQEWPKKCGHMEGKKVISMEEHVMKIKAAIEARRDSNLSIVARTDARAMYGLDEAIHRAKAYSAAGADMLFVEAPQSIDEMKQIVTSLSPLNKPLLANIVESGKTPNLNAAELKKIGFHVAMFPVSAIYTLSKTLMKLWSTLQHDGSTVAMVNQMMPFGEFNTMIGLPEYTALEKRYQII